MRRLGLVGALRGKVKRTTIADPAARLPEDLVQRRFAPPAPDRLWVADIERHEAFANPAVVKGHRRMPVAAGV